MTELLLTAAATEGVTEAASVDLSTILTNVTTAVGGIFNLASEGFSFLTSNPLCFLMIGSGFAFTAFGLVRRALRIAKRT